MLRLSQVRIFEDVRQALIIASKLERSPACGPEALVFRSSLPARRVSQDQDLLAAILEAAT